jgi:hypothetical protein
MWNKNNLSARVATLRKRIYEGFLQGQRGADKTGNRVSLPSACVHALRLMNEHFLALKCGTWIGGKSYRSGTNICR